MSTASLQTNALADVLSGQAPIPLRQVMPWAIFAGLLMLIAIYFVGVEEGAMSLVSGMYVHEYVHDARHVLGFPCH